MSKLAQFLFSAILGASGLQLAAAQQPAAADPQSPGRPLGPTWASAFGGPEFDGAAAVEPAPGGGLFVTGNNFTSGSWANAWVARLNGRGAPLWERVIGTSEDDRVAGLLPTADGGCLLAGHVSANAGTGKDGWLVKLDREGDVEWQRAYGTTAGEEVFTAVDASPLGYYVGGTVARDIESEHDAWVLEVSLAGDVLWQQTLVGERDDWLTALAATPDGLVFTANSSSDFGEPVPGPPFFRPWLVKLAGDGKVLWQKLYDYSGGDAWSDVVSLPDGGFIVTGEILAMGFFRGDLWLVRLNPDGNVVWDFRYGDNFGNNWYDAGHEVLATPDGGFLAAGSTATVSAADDDLWLVKVGAEGGLEWAQAYGGHGYDGGGRVAPAKHGGWYLAGFANLFDASADNVVFRLDSTGGTGAGCELSKPASPRVWTDALSVATVSAAAVPTAVVPRDPAASVQAAHTRRVVCPFMKGELHR